LVSFGLWEFGGLVFVGGLWVCCWYVVLYGGFRVGTNCGRVLAFSGGGFLGRSGVGHVVLVVLGCLVLFSVMVIWCLGVFLSVWVFCNDVFGWGSFLLFCAFLVCVCADVMI